MKSFLYKIFLLFPYSLGRVKKYCHGNEKSSLHKCFDMVSWLLRDDHFNRNYYAFGLNLLNTKQKEYIGRKEFLSIKHKAELLLRISGRFNEFSYDIITKDKFISYNLFSGAHLPCVKVEGLVSGDGVFFNNGEYKPLEILFSINNPFVLKNVVLEAGDGFLLCKPEKGKLLVNNKLFNCHELKQSLGFGKWIMQYKIESHKTIRMVNASALNTTRIVTIRNGKEAVYLTGFQSFATGNQEIDSWGKGAIYVGMSPEHSVLKSPGYYHPSIPGRSIAHEHPDSHIAFENYKIPYLRESVDLCLRAHRLLYNHFVIGWDIAITDDGPLIVEANEKPGMNAVQCVDGGLRERIRECYKNTMEYLKKSTPSTPKGKVPFRWCRESIVNNKVQIHLTL